MSTKKRAYPEDSRTRSPSAPAKATVNDAEAGILSANIEEKVGLLDLEDLAGTVLAVRGSGQVTVIEKLNKSVFKLLAYDACHKLVIVEAWGAKNADFLEKLFRGMQEKAGGAFLVLIPDLKAPRSMFKERGPSAYQKSRENADRVLTFELPETLSVLAPTRELLPKLFEWKDDTYVSGGKVVEHFTKWNEPLESSVIAFVPRVLDVVSYEMSPKKARRDVNVSSEGSAVAVDLLEE